MELAQVLQFRYTSVAQEIVCDTDALARLCDTLDRLQAIAAATLHDRALGTNPQPIADAAPILRVLRTAW